MIPQGAMDSYALHFHVVLPKKCALLLQTKWHNCLKL